MRYPTAKLHSSYGWINEELEERRLARMLDKDELTSCLLYVGPVAIKEGLALPLIGTVRDTTYDSMDARNMVYDVWDIVGEEWKKRFKTVEIRSRLILYEFFRGENGLADNDPKKMGFLQLHYWVSPLDFRSLEDATQKWASCELGHWGMPFHKTSNGEEIPPIFYAFTETFCDIFLSEARSVFNVLDGLQDRNLLTCIPYESPYDSRGYFSMQKVAGVVTPRQHNLAVAWSDRWQEILEEQHSGDPFATTLARISPKERIFLDGIHVLKDTTVIGSTKMDKAEKGSTILDFPEKIQRAGTHLESSTGIEVLRNVTDIPGVEEAGGPLALMSIALNFIRRREMVKNISDMAYSLQFLNDFSGKLDLELSILHGDGSPAMKELMQEMEVVHKMMSWLNHKYERCLTGATFNLGVSSLSAVNKVGLIAALIAGVGASGGLLAPMITAGFTLLTAAKCAYSAYRFKISSSQVDAMKQALYMPEDPEYAYLHQKAVTTSSMRHQLLGMMTTGDFMRAMIAHFFLKARFAFPPERFSIRNNVYDEIQARDPWVVKYRMLMNCCIEAIAKVTDLPSFPRYCPVDVVTGHIDDARFQAIVDRLPKASI